MTVNSYLPIRYPRVTNINFLLTMCQYIVKRGGYEIDKVNIFPQLFVFSIVYL